MTPRFEITATQQASPFAFERQRTRDASLTRNALIATERVHPTLETTQSGTIRIDWKKTIWLAFHLMFGLAGLILWPTLGALAVFLILTAITICAGHSVGMHRLLIHQTFQTPKWLEYLLVWLGTLVGMAGPFGMIRAHDMRDWHQRQITCPAHPAHQAGFWRDAFWQLCCRYDLDHPPDFHIEENRLNDPIYRFIERTWRTQQLPLALALFAIGGWGFVAWGISLRISVSLIGHWAVGHYAHKQGQQVWHIKDLPVQGYNLPGLGLLTFGENWHGNHHAFPHSARLGLEPGQFDPGFLFIQMLANLNLATHIKAPGSAPKRAGLTRLQKASP